MRTREFGLLIAALALVACGGSTKKQVAPTDKAVELKPYETKVKGYLSSVFEVVEGSYKLDYKADYLATGKIQVKVKSIGKGNPKDYGFRDGNGGPLYLTVCTKEGMPIADFADIPSSFEADGLLKDMVTKVGEENWILFESRILRGVLPDDAATFIVTSKQKEEEKESDSRPLTTISSDDEGDSEGFGAPTETSNRNWDKVLDDYEEYVDRAIAIIKKIHAGDNMDALTDYPDMMEKAKDLEESLEKAGDSNDLSSKQIKRMTAIQVKLAKEANEINNLQ
jgi:hypothetical protein